jgi:RHS repeat-associated protein
MTSTTSLVFRHVVRAVLALGLFLASGHTPMRAQNAVSAQDAAPTAGQSTTLLPDGRWLLIGGEQSRGAVVLKDPVTGALTPLRATPAVPRAWHTATLLADGSVLLLGGVDAAGAVVSAPERFTPATQTFESLPVTGFAPRTRHTATTLTDGRVLIVGGASGNFPDDVEIWDPQERVAMPLAGATTSSRRGHTARLLGDGRVLLADPGARSGSTPVELFDPASNSFVSLAASPGELNVFHVAGTSPDGRVPVPVNARFAVWFSSEADVRSLTAATIALEGPEGAVPAVLVPVEQGRLAFLTPTEPLRDATEYQLTVQGAISVSRVVIGAYTRTFRTEEKPKDAPSQSPADDDAWTPDMPAGARGWRTDGSASPWQSLPPLQAPPGVTALAGQALRLDGRPLADVTLEIDGRSARTDRTGRFLLLLPELATGRYELEMDGSTAGGRRANYGFFEAGLTIVASQTNVLPYTMWMPRIDMVHRVRIPSPTTREVVVRTPRIPGLEVRIPPNTVIRDHDGQIVREVSITAIPVDRPPFPLPAGVEVPIYFTIQPGGAYVYTGGKGPRGARVIYPNYYNVASGIIANFWHYDPEENDWYVYGPGVVKGRQVVPNPGVAIYEFTGAMFNNGNTPPAQAAAPGGGPKKGDPVDVATGLFILEKTDLFLADVLPLTLRRTYRPADPAVRPFGIGTTHDYAMFLWSAQEFQEVDLVLPDGGRVHYVRVSPGTSYQTAEFEHTTTPTTFYKSRIKWNGGGWDLTLKDGTVLVFGMQAPLQTIRDRYGNTVRLSYSGTGAYGAGTGRITRVDSPHGRWIEFSYDGSSRVTQARDNIGRTVGYQYNGSGRLWKVTDAAGGVTEYTYDTSHRMLTIKDAQGIVFLTNQYDANGRVSRQTQADSTTFEFDYTVDQNGVVTQADVTDPRGHVSRTTFNQSGYALASIDAVGTPLERTTTLTRNSTSNFVTSVTDPLSRQTDYAYDSHGNLTSLTKLAGTADAVTTTWTYEPFFHQVSSVTDPLSHTASFTYDTLGRLTTMTDPLSHQTTFTNNGAGQPVTVTDALNKTTTFSYTMGNLVSVTSPLGHVQTRFVDAAGRVLQTVDPTGVSTRFEYNPLNQVTKSVDPLSGETSFTYDANGNLLTLRDARGKTTAWTYDVMDRVETRTDPLTRNESFGYDANGNLATWTDRKGQVTTYQYDALDRQTFVGFGATGVPPTYASTISTTYDAGDRATAIVDSVAGTIGRTFNLLDGLTQEVTPEGTVSYTYDDADREATMQVAGQTQVSYTFDNADRLTGVAQGTASATVAYDNANRRTSLTLPNGIVVEYGHDDDSRLTALTYKLGMATLGTLTYGYDPAGQRTSVGGSYARTGLPAALTSATYDDASQLSTFGGATYTYDANGNLAGDGVRTYTWNTRDQLASLAGPVNGSFAYDGVGRRRSKTIGGTTTQFLYDGVNPVQELSGGSPAANLLTGLEIDEFFTRTDAAGVRNYLTDALGSSVALSDGAGTIPTEYTYEPFGETTTSGAATTNAFAFTGREADGTGLYYYRYRYYDSRTQRFLSWDPADFSGGDTNLFAYTSNSPTNVTDPLGACVACPVLWARPWVTRTLPPRMRFPEGARVPKPSPPPEPRPAPNVPWPPKPPYQPNADPWLEFLLDVMERISGGGGKPRSVAPLPGEEKLPGRKPPKCYIRDGWELCEA